MVCTVEHCGRPILVKKVQLCERHYRRWLRHGDPLAGGYSRYVDPLIRFASHIRAAGECDEWTGPTLTSGHILYGRFKDETGKNWLAHRWLYFQVYGPVQPGIVIRHSCDWGLCVRPEHFRAGTQFANVQDMVLRGRGCWQALAEERHGGATP